MWVQTNIHIYSYTLVLFYCFLVVCFVISCSSLTHIVTCKTRTKLKRKKKHNTTTEVKGGVEARRSRWGRYKESEDNEEGGDGMKQDISMYTVLI